MLIDENGNELQVIVDEPDDKTLCVAHGKIYYLYHGDAYAVNPDGTGFEELHIEDFR